MWRVLFLGQGPLAERAYARLIGLGEDADARVVAACSNERGEGTWWGTAAVRELAAALSTPFVPNATRNDAALFDLATSQHVNCLVSVGHPWVLPGRLLEAVATGAAYNLHKAPLPRFGGFHGCSHAILEGATHFGATLHWMDPDPDAGPIAFAEHFEIAPDATALSIHDRAEQAGERLFGCLLECLAEGRLPPRVPMASRPRVYPRAALSAQREIADPADPAEVDRKARALWFPPFEPAFYRALGRTYYVVPPEGLPAVGAPAGVFATMT